MGIPRLDEMLGGGTGRRSVGIREKHINGRIFSRGSRALAKAEYWQRSNKIQCGLEAMPSTL
jgi:hypothetical protein